MNKIITGDSLIELKKLADNSVNCCVTSPPYWGLRDYNLPPTVWPDWVGCLGLEPTPEMYVGHIVLIFKEVFRVLRDDGTLWLNLGDSYMGAASEHKDKGSFGKHSCIAKGTQSGVPINGRKERNKNLQKGGYKPKDMVGIPWMVAFALRADGWYLRQDIIWHKPNPMPESVTDRCTKAHEYIFLLSKSKKYYYDADAIKEPAAYLQANSPESIKSPHAQNIKKYKGNANTFRGGSYCNGNKDNSELGRRKVSGNNVTGNYPGRDDKGKACNSPDQITRNKRSVWTISTKPFKEAHYATFPQELIVDCIKAGCQGGGVVLDPFFGSGTTGLVANKLNCKYIGIELGENNIEIANNRLYKELGMFM